MSGGDGFLTVDVEGAKFCLGGGWNNCFDDLCDSEDSSIVGRVGGIFREEEVAAGLSAGLGFR